MKKFSILLCLLLGLFWYHLSFAGPPIPIFHWHKAFSAIPADDDTYDLGSAILEWRNLNIDGTANIDSLVADVAVIIPSATEAIALDIQGETNDYTGAAACFGQKIQRDINWGTGAIANAAGQSCYLNLKHTDATITDDYFSYGGIARVNSILSRITNEGANDWQYWETGAHNTAKSTGRFDTDSTGILKVAFMGTYSWAWADGYTVYDTSTGSPANTFDAYGYVAKVENKPLLDGTADGTFTSAGLYVEEVTGNAAGTSTGYGIYINSVTGSDNNYAFYDNSGADSVFTGKITAKDLYTENGATSAGSVYFYEDSSNGTNTVQLIGPASTADVVQTLQAVTGTIYSTGGSDVAVVDGGTGVTSPTDHCVIVGSGATAMTVLGVGTAKEVLKGVTGADPDFVTERCFSTQNHTSTGNITEAHILASKWHTNNGASAEVDLTLPALSYTVGFVFIVQDAFISEINPPSGELFDHDGTDLDADDCIDLSIVIGDKIAFTRILLADGSTWRWSTDTIRGVHVDTGASD